MPRSFRSCRDANIAVRSDFLVGFPGEKEEDFEQTWSFVVENKELLDTPFFEQCRCRL